MAATKVGSRSVAIAMAFAGRSARACDVCANKSAHWFCAADDAYLCTGCDTQVHSANALSLRHERVRLSQNGTPMKAKRSFSKVPKEEEGCRGHRSLKELHPSPPQVAPVRKRSRTSRPHSHHLKKLTQVVKSEDQSFAVKAELGLFDFLDADEFLVNDAGNQEVPNLSTVTAHDSSPSSSDFGLLPSDYEFQEGDHSASADSFAVFFKSKAAHSQKVSDDGDQFLVPDTLDEFCLDGEMSSDTSDVVPADGNIGLAGEAFFFPGDIPGLDGFESFVPEMDLSDDFSLSFDLALQNSNGVEAFEGDGVVTSEAKGIATQTSCKADPQPDQFATGPFAKFFSTKTKAERQEPLGPESIKREAKAMLECCMSGDSVDSQRVPSLQLNLKDVLTAWSDRGEPWVDYKVPFNDSNSSGTSDVGLVPDMDAAAGDDSQSGGDRGARVMRYKEKRRTRLFSKKIRYEVRKLNAERRPRMKGRFVKRTTTTS